MSQTRLILIATACAALGACATHGAAPLARIETKFVDVAVHEPCQAKEPGQPDFADSAAKIRSAPAADAAAAAYAAGRKQHYAYEGELRAWGEGCAK